MVSGVTCVHVPVYFWLPGCKPQFAILKTANFFHSNKNSARVNLKMWMSRVAVVLVACWYQIPIVSAAILLAIIYLHMGSGLIRFGAALGRTSVALRSTDCLVFLL